MKQAFFYLFLLSFLIYSGGAFAQESQKFLKSPDDIPKVQLSDLLAGVETEQRGEKLYVRISVADLLNLTLKANLNLVSLRLQEQEALAQQQGARGIFDFNLKLEAELATSVGLTSSVGVAPATGASAYLKLVGSNLNIQRATLSKPTRLGWRYQFSHVRTIANSTNYEVSSAGANPSRVSTNPVFYTQATEAKLTMPFLRGAGWKFNSIPLRRAEIGLASQISINRNTEEQILREVAFLYWRMVGAQETLVAREQAVELSQQLLEDATTRFNVGTLSRLGVSSAESRLASRQQEALQAELAVLEIENLLQAGLNLSELRIGLIPKDVAGERNIEGFDRLKLLVQVKKNNQELAFLDSQLEQTRLKLLQATNESRSQLDLELSYKQKGFGDSFANSSKIYPAQNEQEVKLTWQIPLFGRKPKLERKQYFLEEQRTFLAIKNKQTELEVSLLGILRELNLNKGGIDQAESSQRLARIRLESEVQKFRIGRSTNTSVTQAQNEFTNAQLGTILAKTRFEESYLKLVTLTGNIYTAFGLESSYATKATE